jgi:hypothetical protein
MFHAQYIADPDILEDPKLDSNHLKTDRLNAYAAMLVFALIQGTSVLDVAPLMKV